MRYSHLASDVARRAVQRMEAWTEEKLSELTDTKTSTDTKMAVDDSIAQILVSH